MTCNKYLVAASTLSGSISFFCSFIAQIPQVIEIYQYKTVEGISISLLLLWFMGDVTSIVGAVLTKQLFFQIVLCIYFLLSDILILSQYYYYGVYHNNELAEVYKTEVTRHKGYVEERRSRKSISSATSAGLLAVSLPAAASAMPLIETASHKVSETFSNDWGYLLSWIGGTMYLTARFPQLYKNYCRKSTDGISPFLFGCTLVSNITYSASIFLSCEFTDNENRMAFFINELPFIVGSAGTVLLDVIYFYQYFLYKDSEKIVDVEDEETPLLQ